MRYFPACGQYQHRTDPFIISPPAPADYSPLILSSNYILFRKIPENLFNITATTNTTIVVSNTLTIKLDVKCISATGPTTNI